jgi:hypothetical protein
MIQPIVYSFNELELFPEYPQYFLSVVKYIKIIKDSRTITIRDKTRERPSRVVVESSDENALFFFDRAVQSEIRANPFSFALPVPLDAIDRMEQPENAALKASFLGLREGYDFMTLNAAQEPGAHPDEPYLYIRFNKHSDRDKVARAFHAPPSSAATRDAPAGQSNSPLEAAMKITDGNVYRLPTATRPKLRLVQTLPANLEADDKVVVASWCKAKPPSP